MKTWHLRVVDAEGRPTTGLSAEPLLRYVFSWLWFLPALVSVWALRPARWRRHRRQPGRRRVIAYLLDRALAPAATIPARRDLWLACHHPASGSAHEQPPQGAVPAWIASFMPPGYSWAGLKAAYTGRKRLPAGDVALRHRSAAVLLAGQDLGTGGAAAGLAARGADRRAAELGHRGRRGPRVLRKARTLQARQGHRQRRRADGAGAGGRHLGRGHLAAPALTSGCWQSPQRLHHRQVFTASVKASSCCADRRRPK